MQHAIVAVAAIFSLSLLPLFVCAALLNDITCSNINMTGSKARQGEQTTTCTTNGNRMCWLGSCEVMFRPGQRLHTYIRTTASTRLPSQCAKLAHRHHRVPRFMSCQWQTTSHYATCVCVCSCYGPTGSAHITTRSQSTLT